MFHSRAVFRRYFVAVFIAASAVSAFARIPAAHAETRSYTIQGRILEMDERYVILESGGKIFEFDRDAGQGLDLPGKVKKGDRVSLRYSIDARGAHLLPRQEAGQKNTTPLMDDRAFFPA